MTTIGTRNIFTKPVLGDWDNDNRKCDPNGDVYISITGLAAANKSNKFFLRVLIVPAYGRGITSFSLTPKTDSLELAVKAAREWADKFWNELPEYNPPKK